LSFRETSSFIPGLKYYQNSFKEFGNIKDILFRPSQHEELKSFMLIEMETLDQALRIKDYYNNPEKGYKRKKILGGTSLEINILTEPQEAGNSYSIIKPNINKYLGKSAPLMETKST
jgi:hypothetical protein